MVPAGLCSRCQVTAGSSWSLVPPMAGPRIKHVERLVILKHRVVPRMQVRHLRSRQFHRHSKALADETLQSELVCTTPTYKKVQPAMDGTHSASRKPLNLRRSGPHYPCLQPPIFPEEMTITTCVSIELLLLLSHAYGKK
jgi:hypothetical protein